MTGSAALVDLREQLEAIVAEVPAAEIADAVGLCAAAQARLLARLTRAPAPVGGEGWVTAGVVAERFQLALSTVHELARQGRIPCRTFGRYRRFRLSDVAQRS